MSIVTGWITDRMGFNPINPFNGQLKNGTLNGVKNVKCEQTLMLRLYLWIWIAFYLWNITEDKVSVAKRVKAPGSEREVGCFDSNPLASLLLLTCTSTCRWPPGQYFWEKFVVGCQKIGRCRTRTLRNALRADDEAEGLFTRPVKGHCFSHRLKRVKLRQKDQRCRWQK